MSAPENSARNPADFVARWPAALVAVALMLGIFAHQAAPALPIVWTIAVAALIAIAIFCSHRAALSSGAIFLATFFAGLAVAQVEAFYYPRDHVSAFAMDQPRLTRLELYVSQPPRVLTWPYGQYRATPPKQVVTATVRRIKTWTGWADCTGDVLVQIAQPHPRLAQGQTIRVLAMLERPGPAMNPGQFDWAKYYREQRILASVNVPHADDITILSQGSIGPLSWLREQARRLLARGFAQNRALDHALLRALVLGDNDPELRDVQEQFRRTGTSHHLAISGMHVAVLGGVVFFVCRLLRMGPRAASLVSLALVILYGIVALPSPPVVRSILLCIAFSLGILGRKSVDALQLLAMSVIAMLVYHPMDLFNAGFQLSFGTVLGLLLLTRPLLATWRHNDIDQQIAFAMQRPGRFSLLWMQIKSAARVTLAAAVVAWLVSMPLIALYFEQLNPWAILASIVLAPFVFVALIGGFAKIFLTFLFPSLASIWAGAAALPIAGMRHMVDWLATFPGADVPFPSPTIGMVLLYYVLLVMAIRMRLPMRIVGGFTRSGAFAGCLAVAILPMRRGFENVRTHAGDLKVTLLSIGAGQCCAVEPPGAQAVMIDAGSDSISDVLHKAVGPFLRHEGRRNVGSVFISHANYDHFSAVADIASAYDVNEIYVSPQFRPQSVGNLPAEHMLQALDAMDRAPRLISTGQSIDLGGSAKLDVLWPPPDCPLDANNCGQVLKLTFAGRTVLFTADVQIPAEKELLLKSAALLKADVLVAPHHGSYETSTDAFVSAIEPQCIVCSNDRTLSGKQRDFDRAMRNRVVYRTHTSGAITIRITPQGVLSVEPYLK
jgi:competence protein ComEC